MPFETIDEKIAKLTATLRSEMQEERARRAERFADRMNKWVATIIAIVSLLLFVFAALGYKGYTDIQRNSERVQALADDVSVKAAKIDDYAKQAELSMAKLQQQSLNTANLQSNVGLLVGTDPIILQVPLSVGVSLTSTVEGKNFGKTPGHLYVLVQGITATAKPIEIERSSIQTWNDKSISFSLSHSDDLALAYAARELDKLGPFAGMTPFISFTVRTADGKTSGWSPVTGFVSKALSQRPDILDGAVSSSTK